MRTLFLISLLAVIKATKVFFSDSLTAESFLGCVLRHEPNCYCHTATCTCSVFEEREEFCLNRVRAALLGVCQDKYNCSEEQGTALLYSSYDSSNLDTENNVKEEPSQCFDGFFECHYSCCFEGKCGASPVSCEHDFEDSIKVLGFVYFVFIVSVVANILHLLSFTVKMPKGEKKYVQVEAKSVKSVNGGQQNDLEMSKI